MKTKIKQMLKKLILIQYRFMTKVLPIRKNVIVFQSNVGRNYTGNPKSIYEEMVAKKLDQRFRCYYILDNPHQTIPGNGKTVRNSRFFYYYLMAVAGIWISDARFPNYIIKRKGVTFLQTWHGTPLKKLALDMDSLSMADEGTLEEYQENFRRSSKTWDYLIAQNEFSSQIFKRAFDFHGTMLEIGYPRNDVLFRKNNPECIVELKKKLGIPLDKKVLLYAPTWRDDAYYDKSSYKFVSPLDFKKVKDALSSDYIMIVKYHYMVKECIDWSIYDGFYRVFDNSYDIADLYLVSDMLITDYSSVMFDYSLLKRPMLFYAYDLEQYKNTLRGFYFDFEKEAPGPIFTTTEEFITQVINYEPNSYKDKYELFDKKYHSYESGNAAEQVIKLICSL